MKEKKLIITINDEKLFAVLEENAASRNLIKQLPLNITMDDLFRREKYMNHFELEAEKSNTSYYSKGDISYYLPMNALVFYYEGEQEPLNGLVKLGEITNGIEKLASYSGSVDVKIEVK